MARQPFRTATTHPLQQRFPAARGKPPQAAVRLRPEAVAALVLDLDVIVAVLDVDNLIGRKTCFGKFLGFLLRVTHKRD
jgi:hypothetical protein